MASKRKRSTDYRRELKDLQAQEKALRARIIKHAEELCQKYPGVRIGEFCVIDYIRFVEDNNLTEAFMVMEAIEKDLEAKHPHKQTAFEFPTVVPAPPVGERFIISDGVAYTRKSEEEAMKCSKSPDGKHQFGFDGSTCSYCGANVAYL